MKIAVDLDGVLAEPMSLWCKLYNDQHRTHLTLQDIKQWDVPSLLHISSEEFYRTLDDAWMRWEEIPPTEDDLARKVANACRYGKIDIVTGRSEKTVKPCISWLREHSIPFEDFIRVASIPQKVTLDYDVYIDDSPRLFTRLLSRLTGHGILYTRPWNKSVNDDDRIYRVNSWKEIPDVLNSLNRRN